MPRSFLKVAFWTPVAALGIGLILLLCAAAAAAAIATLLTRAACRTVVHARTMATRELSAESAEKEEPAAANRAG